MLGQLKSLDDDHKFDCAGLIDSYGGKLGDLPIVRLGDKYLSSSEFEKKLKRLKEVSLIGDDDLSHSDEDDCGSSAFDTLVLRPNVVVHPEKMSSKVIEEIIRAVWRNGYSVEDDLIDIGSVGFTDIYRSGNTFKRNAASRSRAKKKK